MTIVITCGFFKGLEPLGRKLLQTVDVSTPQFQDNISPGELSEKYRQSRKLSLQTLSRTRGKTHISRAWEVAVSQLLIGHYDSASWGWVDHNSAYLLDFWKDFDPSTRYLFLYSSPARCLEMEMRAGSMVQSDALLDNWRLYNEHLLEFYHRNRDISLLVNVDTLTNAIGLFSDLATEQFELSTSEQDDIDHDAVPLNDGRSSQEDALASPVEIGQASEEAIKQLDSVFESDVLESADDLAQVVARAAALENQECISLYSELESSADMTLLDANHVPHPSFSSAVQLFTKLSADSFKLASLEKESAEKADASQKDARRQEALIKRLQEDVDFVVQEKSLLHAQLFKLQEETEKLHLEGVRYRKELSQVLNKSEAAEAEQKQLIKKQAKEIEALKQKNKDISGFKDRAAEAKQLQNSLSDTQKRLNDTQKRLSDTQKELDAAKKRANENSKRQDGETKNQFETIKVQNQLLTKQLHQVQEELERYFIKYRDSEKQVEKLKRGAAANSSAKPKLPEPTDHAKIDLRHFIEGKNWHSAEDEGRWTGPGTTSTLKLPNLKPGRYKLKLHIVSAMSADIVNGLSAEINGRKVTLKKIIRSDLEGSLAPLKRLKTKIRAPDHPYPILIAGVVDIVENENRAVPELALIVPRTISPTELGEEDSRHLAVRYEKIELDPAQ